MSTARSVWNSVATARAGTLVLTFVATTVAFVMALLNNHAVAQVFFAVVSVAVLVVIARIVQRALVLAS